MRALQIMYETCNYLKINSKNRKYCLQQCEQWCALPGNAVAGQAQWSRFAGRWAHLTQ